LNVFKSAPSETKTKSEETGKRILDAALTLFRQKGFDATTMREIAENAGVATGAAYYYYPSKEAIVLDFYERSCTEMQPLIEAATSHAKRFDAKLRELIRVKIDFFSPYRGVMRALLRNGADPKHPLSPFSTETTRIREIDVAWFRTILNESKTKVTTDLEPHLPGVLWFFQMGIILFWVVDESENHQRTSQLLDRSVKVVAGLVRLSSLPLLRPIRRTAVELIEIVKGGQS